MQNFNNSYGNFSYGYPNQYSQQKTNQYAFVNGLEGAKTYPIQPNQTLMLLDNDNPIIYKKVSDNYGQSVIEYFQMIPITEKDVKNILTPPNPDYVLKSDFDKLLAKIEELTVKKEGAK